VTVTVYVPAARPLRSSEEEPLLHAIVKGDGVPPVIVKSTAPSEPPKHVTFVMDEDRVGAVQVGAFKMGLVVVTKYWLAQLVGLKPGLHKGVLVVPT
jgi:hypothetical protein